MPLYDRLFIGTDSSPRLTRVDGETGTPTGPAVPPTGQANHVRVSPTGQYVAVAHNNAPRVSVYNTADLSKLADPASALPGNATGVAWSPDGWRLAVGHAVSPFVSIYDMPGFVKLPNPPELPAGVGNALAWSPSGARLAVPHLGTPFLTIYNTFTWLKVALPASIPGAGNGAAWSPDGSLLAVSHGGSPFVTVFDTSDWSKLPPPSVLPPTTGNQCAFSPDGAHLLVTHAAAGGHPGYMVYRVADWSVVSGLPSTPSGVALGAAWVDNERFAVTHIQNPYGIVVELATGDVEEHFAGYVSSGSRAVDVLRLEVDESINIDAPLRFVVTAGARDIDAPLRFVVGVPRDIDAPLRFRAIAASAVGGLGGAGGWPAAPDGRWRAHVWVGGEDFSAQLVSDVEIFRERDAAARARFAFRPPLALQPAALVRMPVRIAFSDWAGTNVQPMFVGILDVPSPDMRTGLLTCECTDRLPEAAAAASREWVDSAVGGHWSAHVFGEPADNWEYLQQRISTVPRSFALDVSGTLRVVPWSGLPRVVSVQHGDYEDASLEVRLPDSAQIRTRVTVRLQYRYQRLRARGAVLAWSQPFSFFASWGGPVTGLRLRYWLRRGMVEQATERLPGWERVGAVAMEHPAPGTYYSSSSFLGYIIPKALAVDLVQGFEARYRTRWVQTVTEHYAITLRLAALEDAIGVVPDEVGANVSAPAPPDDWARDYSVTPALPAPALGDALAAWQPEGDDAAARDAALRTLHAQAWCMLYRSTHTGSVAFELPLRPEMWFDTWVEFDDKLRAAGPVAELQHRLSVLTGRATTRVQIACGLPGDASAAQPELTVPTLPAEDLSRPVSAYSVECGTFVGGEVAVPEFDPETMIGFLTNTDRRGQAGADDYVYYPHRLSIRAPDVAALDRDPLERAVDVVIDTAVPTSLLEIEL